VRGLQVSEQIFVDWALAGSTTKRAVAKPAVVRVTAPKRAATRFTA
jgi:hypothetical protein